MDPLKQDANAYVQSLYAESDECVRGRSFDERTAAIFFGDYVEFVSAVAMPKGTLLDVGCGSGWSSRFLSERGFRATGLDLNASAFEVTAGDNLELRVGSAMHLPFEDRTFDVVCAYQALEHMPDPAKVLSEMGRVLKPGGVACIVGPNLLSLFGSLRALGIYVWRNRPLRSIFLRHANMARHPQGNTLPEVIGAMALNVTLIVKKSLSTEPTFTMRTPDVNPPFHADNDACYLCNPIDISNFFERSGYEILQNGKIGRPALLRALVSGTWVAARKGS